MSIPRIVLIAISLAMDAFAVAISKGLSSKKFDINKALLVGAYFGFFQGLMPLIGYFVGSTFQKFITSVDHWVVFALLLLVGIGMILESFKNEEENDDLGFKIMLVLSFATSIDALAIGISFSFFEINIYLSALIIAFITFIISFIGFIIGNRFGNKYEKISKVIGGIILILIGIKILIEHLNA